MNSIYLDQNVPENIRLICSFRESYYLAKKILLIQIYITVLLTVCFSTVKFLFTLIKIDIAVYAGLYSLLVFIIDFFILQPRISKYRTEGAKLQEEFDHNVFKFQWNKMITGDHVEREIVSLRHLDYLKRVNGDLEKCQDWYPEEYKFLEINQAILSCQKTSLVYDIALRKRFNTLIVRNTILLSLFVATLCLINDLSLNAFILYVVLPLLPALILAKKLHQEHEKSIKASNDLKAMIDTIQLKDDTISLADLLAIQTKIFHSRKDSALIPERIYNKLRDKLEKQMHVHASIEVNKTK